eukprot:CAMPEP_0118944332 /NCGR_PEP_ID=MMETSP1169-20130426/40088_1 /TAXON_ID=36882 /ORGANISM="Pyramimonas obovata, Strain CCMP722" /LENGTH=268 /DNA_ID=CAMNT_0006889791 /DNA_START=132 /DNA_END=934 /DNA_ORIENTATION=+
MHEPLLSPGMRHREEIHSGEVDETERIKHPLTSEDIEHVLEGLCHDSRPRSLIHGIFLYGLGGSIREKVTLLSLLSGIGAMVTFLTAYIAQPMGEAKCDSDVPYNIDPGIVVDGLAREWGLVCADSWKLELIGTLFFAGGFIGVALAGWMSDVYGRRTASLSLLGITCISMGASAMAPTWETYAALRFVMGISANGMYLTSFTLLMEWVPAGWHTCTGTGAYVLLFAFGEIWLAAMAYALRQHNWQALVSAVTVLLCAMLALLYLLMP